MVISEKQITESLFALLWLWLGLIPARMAFRKGRNMVAWWFFGGWLWPLTLLIVRLFPPVQKTLDAWEADPEEMAREQRQQTRVVWAFMLAGLLPIWFGSG